MAIFRCNKCAYLREVPSQYVGKSTKCPVCQQENLIYDTVDFVNKLLQKYFGLYAELRQLRKELQSTDSSSVTTSDDFSERVDIDIHNTSFMMDRKQYQPIIDWFQQQQIKVEIDPKTVDTTGFFDEIAVRLGEDYDMLKEVSERIKRAQIKSYTNAMLNLSDNSQKEMEQITKFCRELYEYSFVSKYYYDKQEKRIRLSLQTAPAIVSFFNGGWVEWYVFMKILKLFYENNISFSCSRNITVYFPNEDKYELDVFFLIKGDIPLCIECKSGEFRQFIGKYSKLRSKLKIEKAHFLLLSVGLSDQQTQGLTSMFDITFVNEKNFLEYIAKISL